MPFKIKRINHFPMVNIPFDLPVKFTYTVRNHNYSHYLLTSASHPIHFIKVKNVYAKIITS